MDIIWDLNFAKSYDPPTFDDVNLKFGEKGGEDIDPAFGEMDLVKAKPVIDFALLYDSAVSRPVAGEIDTAWNGATPTPRSAGSEWNVTERKYKEVTNLPWEVCNQLQTGASEKTKNLKTSSVERVLPWNQARQIYPETYRGFYKTLREFPNDAVIPWNVAAYATRVALDGFQQGIWAGNASEIPWTEAVALFLSISGSSQPAKYLQRALEIPWQQGRLPPQGISKLPPVKPPDPPYVYSTDLNFECPYVKPDPLNVLLNFGLKPCSTGGGDVPAREVYFIVNELLLFRASDGVPIEVHSVNVGTDDKSWAWKFTAKIAWYDLEKVEPTSTGPVEVELRINGVKWRFLVESYDDDKKFAEHGVGIEGRSVTAWLDDPYAPKRSFIQDTGIFSRQFAEAELIRPGLISTFDLDWLMPDELGWQMPANTWSYTDLTPMAVINQIVQGAGGFVNSHPFDKTVIVRPEYKVPFWEWDTTVADKAIPHSLVMHETLKWSQSPLYNGVYVSGENTGVEALVRRMGTLGDFQAPSYTSPFISDTISARMKGMAILSAGGKQSMMGVELPMHEDLGLVTPGMLISVNNAGFGMPYTGWRGIVRSTGISGAWDQDGLKISQSLSVERHYGGAF